MSQETKITLITCLVCMNLIQIPLLLMPSMIHIPARLLLSVVKNAIPLSCLIHLMILCIYIGWHRRVLCYMLNRLVRSMDYNFFSTFSNSSNNAGFLGYLCFNSSIKDLAVSLPFHFISCAIFFVIFLYSRLSFA